MLRTIQKLSHLISDEPVPKKSVTFGMRALIVFVFIQTDVRELYNISVHKSILLLLSYSFIHI